MIESGSRLLEFYNGEQLQLVGCRCTYPTYRAKFLRQSFVEWAGETVRYSFWAKAYYEQQKQKGKPHQSIIRCLAFKWIRIIFRCWKSRIKYDESTYLNALKKRGSPFLEYAISA